MVHWLHSHRLVDIKCLSIYPLFWDNLTPNDPFFSFKPHPMTPFSTLVSNFTYKLQIFACFACILRNLNILQQFFINIKFANFGLKLHFCILNDPHFGSPHQKDPIFFEPTLNDPPFPTKSYTQCPLLSFSGRHMYVPFICKYPPGTCPLKCSHITVLLFRVFGFISCHFPTSTCTSVIYHATV